MKLNRNSKKWKDCFNNRLKDLVKQKGTIGYITTTKNVEEKYKYPFIETYRNPGLFTNDSVDIVIMKEGVLNVVMTTMTSYDAMPDRIKEAEEYADRLFSAMR